MKENKAFKVELRNGPLHGIDVGNLPAPVSGIVVGALISFGDDLSKVISVGYKLSECSENTLVYKYFGSSLEKVGA